MEPTPKPLNITHQPPDLCIKLSQVSPPSALLLGLPKQTEPLYNYQPNHNHWIVVDRTQLKEAADVGEFSEH